MILDRHLEIDPDIRPDRSRRHEAKVTYMRKMSWPLQPLSTQSNVCQGSRVTGCEDIP